MKTSTIRFINLSLSLIILAGVIFVYNVLVKPAYQEVNALKGNLSSRSELLKDQRKVVEQVKTLLAQYQGLSGPQKAISFALPQSEEFPTLINQLRARSAGSGLLLESVSFRPLVVQVPGKEDTATIPKVATIQIALQFRGPYSALKTFVQSLESNVRIMDMDSLQLSTASGDPVNHSYNLTVNTYYLTI